MTLSAVLYKLILGPLELLFDVIYATAYHMTENPGLSIIFLSLAMNLLVLPLYRRADAMQEEERVQSMALQPGIDHIKKTFKGNERFMMLQTYYRQNNYKPWYALKGSLSLLLEVPFFIAAYRFLSGLQLLQGVAFGPIRDLGQPDGLLFIAGHSAHLLPILMTLINIVSGAIYTRGMPLKSKVQLYGMALVFLVLLYPSPSGLVFYWTLNNLFSLVKNIFYKLRDPKKVLSALCAALGLALLTVLLFIRPMDTLRKQLVLVAVALALLAPLALLIYRRKHPVRPARAPKGNGSAVFLLCGVMLTVLTGVVIPSSVIRSSPAEFVNIDHFHSPVLFLLSATLLAAGTFLVWGNIFYRLASPAGQRLFSYGLLAATGVAIVDFMLFGKDYGNMSSMLQYDALFSITGAQYLTNIAILLGVAAALYLLWRFGPILTRVICLAGIIALCVMSFTNVSDIQGYMSATEASIERVQAHGQAVLPLSRTGKNVVVLMMDKAINRFFPYLIEEKPELKEQFDGFTYYPNTISYGNFTNVGSPALYGGYGYTPENLNLRPEVSLPDKQNEALRVMPANFYNAGFEVTVCDPSYASYLKIPDLSVFDDFPGMHSYVTIGRFNEDEERTVLRLEQIWERNLFCYSVFRSSPLLFHPTLYNNGLYNESNAIVPTNGDAGDVVSVVQTIEGTSMATGIRRDFVDSFSVLQNLPNITDIRDDGKNTFLMMANETTHDLTLLKEPEYVPADIVDNRQYDRAHASRYAADGSVLKLHNRKQMTFYHCNMAAMLQLGKWFDYLRENGVYDNTRIIIVSDHGRGVNLFNLRIGRKPLQDLTCYNPQLLVKDFNSHGLTTDTTFMTNADTSSLAFEGLVEHPVNPLDGQPLSTALKDEPVQHVVHTTHWNIRLNHGNTYTGLIWLEARSDMDAYDWPSAWRVLGKGKLPPEK